MSAGQLREVMPQCAAWIDALRQAFGAAVVDAALRRTARGGRAVHLVEVGPDGVRREWGRPLPQGGVAVEVRR